MRPSRRIERIARHDAESEPRIEARGLRILLIDIDTPHAAAGDGMFHETPPQPPAPQVGRDEKHLEHPVRYAREGGETAAGTADVLSLALTLERDARRFDGGYTLY